MTLADPVAILNGAPGALDPALVLLAALALDALIGDPRWLWAALPHPVVLIGKPIDWLEKKLNRAERGRLDRTIRGAVVVGVVVGVWAAIGWGLHLFFASFPYGMAAEAALVAVMLAGRSLYDHVGRVAKALKTGGAEAGREAVRHIVGRDPDQLDRHGVARSAIESLAENFADGLVAPAFWYLLLGLPGLFAYKAINTLDSMLGYKSPRLKAFGLTAARLDDAANYIPARLSGLLIGIGAAFAPGAAAGRALNWMVKESPKHASPNAGWPEAAMAGAYDFALGGPRRYPGGVSEAAWIGSGRARLEARDIRRAQRLYVIACALGWIAVAGVALAGWG
ncbi:MAG: adenosylcobinamide-phosphate synthase CbiB [Marivibrio sp.]|uniref:adenosylcobinamide-phosphate synthase CbiB n=1 Tax=Marivibrio sp. TaxID=2039719 RepID=UPI0032EE463C